VPISREIRALEGRWQAGQGWPKRLEWIEIEGIRGWKGQRIEFPFPITALIGENGIGKSTLLQGIASCFKGDEEHQNFASDFFPDTPWEQVTGAEIRVSIREGYTSGSIITTVRKPNERWRGNEDRRERNVEYIDLRRIQPMMVRTGYARMAKKEVRETTSETFDAGMMGRMSGIMGRNYDLAGISRTEVDETRAVPVLSKDGRKYSGFHGGGGEIVMAELLQRKIPKYSLLLIDEIETSLHPRTQRRLIRDIATMCRNLELQCILTTHSPYILDEIPPEGRLYLLESDGQRKTIRGVSPAFAMTRMDDEVYPEADVYTEDERAATLVNEIIAISRQRDLILRYQTIPYGAANVGRSLGQMAKERRFPRPSVVFLDGDQVEGEGCLVLPGDDAPERVVFEALTAGGVLEGVASRLSRSYANVADSCRAAMLVGDHHEWVRYAADRLSVPGSVLWQGMCAEWAKGCFSEDEVNRFGDALFEMIREYGPLRGAPARFAGAPGGTGR